MAHHQQSGYDRFHAAMALSCSSGLETTGDKPAGGDDEPADVDEPPDERLYFGRVAMPTSGLMSDHGSLPSPHFLKTRNASLLTQALLSSSDHTSGSEAEAPVLTSDGGPTSPNTPSPPLPAADGTGYGSPTPKELSLSNTQGHSAAAQAPTIDAKAQAPQARSLEAGLKQRRCITFACGRQSTSQAEAGDTDQSHNNVKENIKPVDPPKRPSMLRFACPFKAPVEAVRGEAPAEGQVPKVSRAVPKTNIRHDRDIRSTVSTLKNTSQESVVKVNEARPSAGSAAKRQKLEKSEPTTFHAFGGSFGAEDEWTKEEIKGQPKLTVNDTLRKENAIRQLGQEAEDEAIEDDDEDEDEDEDEDDDEADNGIEEVDSDEDVTDGNETDNEEGFADSDDDSDMDSDYQFWTPGLTTAATSTDHIEHIRPLTKRVASDSSIESMINIRERRSNYKSSAKRISRSRSTAKAERMRPGTPDLPDSTDFVCGTLDEDRPLEAAYASCLEQRKRSKHTILPQDIDPSFPTSDPELNEEDDDEEDDAMIRSSDGSDAWVAGRPDNSDSEDFPHHQKPLPRRGGKSPMPSPKRMRSPPPPGKRATVHRSPPPRRLFGQSPTSNLAPARLQHELKSPLSTRLTSPCASPKKGTNRVAMGRLAQRPHLTHTASLPRTPNPFWSKHRKYLDDLDDEATATDTKGQEIHSRGPIDIVQGLERKRQRRREKFWRQHCRTAGKDKERKCHSGRGAQRMREVGLEMAEKCRGYGTKAQVVLSV